MYHKEWDHNVMMPGIFRDFAKEINAKIDERVAGRTREIAKKMKVKKKPINEIIEFTGLSKEEIEAL